MKISIAIQYSPDSSLRSVSLSRFLATMFFVVGGWGFLADDDEAEAANSEGDSLALVEMTRSSSSSSSTSSASPGASKRVAMAATLSSSMDMNK